MLTVKKEALLAGLGIAIVLVNAATLGTVVGAAAGTIVFVTFGLTAIVHRASAQNDGGRAS